MGSALRNRVPALPGRLLAGVAVLAAAGGRDVLEARGARFRPWLASGPNGAAVTQFAMPGQGWRLNRLPGPGMPTRGGAGNRG
jgi:hypothetical protein